MFNVNTIKAEARHRIHKSDVQYNATKGIAGFKDAGPYGDSGRVRCIGAVHSRCAKGSERQDVRRFQNKRFNVGNRPGTRASMEELLAAMGWKMSDFALASELKADEHGPALATERSMASSTASVMSANIRIRPRRAAPSLFR